MAERWAWGSVDTNVLLGSEPPVHRVILVIAGEEHTTLTLEDKALIATAPDLLAACALNSDGFGEEHAGISSIEMLRIAADRLWPSNLAGWLYAKAEAEEAAIAKAKGIQ